MGKIIMCHGRTAQVPYIFELSKTPVYTIEEMSYYLYEHIYEIHEEFLNDELIQWVREQLELDGLAGKLEQLNKKRKNLKDIVVTILCSNDYYMEKEIKEIIGVIDAIMDLNPLEKRKLKGDYYLKYGMYRNAFMIYNDILKEKEVGSLGDEQIGNILHNLAITHVHIASYKEAAITFKKAYTLNHNAESLRQYLLTLKIDMEEEEFKKELHQYQMKEEFADNIRKTIVDTEKEAKKSGLYKFLEHLGKEKEEGKATIVRGKMENLLSEWKQEYRRGRQE